MRCHLRFSIFTPQPKCFDQKVTIWVEFGLLMPWFNWIQSVKKDVVLESANPVISAIITANHIQSVLG